MLAQPVSNGGRGADRASYEQTFAPADQTAKEHPAAGSHSNFGQISTVVADAFELTFGINVRAASGIRVDKRSVENEALSVGEHQFFGEDRDGGLAGDAARLSPLSHAAFDGCADWDHGIAAQYHGLGDSG